MLADRETELKSSKFSFSPQALARCHTALGGLTTSLDRTMSLTHVLEERFGVTGCGKMMRPGPRSRKSDCDRTQIVKEAQGRGNFRRAKTSTRYKPALSPITKAVAPSPLSSITASILAFAWWFTFGNEKVIDPRQRIHMMDNMIFPAELATK